MDLADQADLQQEGVLEHNIASSHKPEGPAPSGVGHWCGESVAYPRRFCDAECRNEWERRR